MVCIYCSHDTQVVNSRHQKRINNVWRRRTCKACHVTFTTIEAPDLNANIVVRRSKTLVEPFWREKLLLSIHGSLLHRKQPLHDATGLLDTIINNIVTCSNRGEVSIIAITHEVTSVLEHFDNLAATHYKAFHDGKGVRG